METIILALQEGGVDMIEIGLPYSDPLADGPTIQESSSKALARGATLDKIFDRLAALKPQLESEIYLMGYYNQWLSYGLERFCARVKETGATGLIIPDLPVDYFDQEHRSVLERHGLAICFLVTPDTPESRIAEIDQLTTGFVYLVSSKSTTGKTAAVFDENQDYFKKMKAFPFRNRTMIGFGIQDHESFANACSYADGAIIGSAFIRHIEKDPSRRNIIDFVNQIRKGK
jgi:tryptophan synthase alpha chain